MSEHLSKHSDELFFTKLRDWESEVEYRFVTRWDSADELFVNIHPALKGVVLGHAVSMTYVPSLAQLCQPFGIRLAKLRWRNGRPVVSSPIKSVPAEA
jgi:hypothetical protein